MTTLKQCRAVAVAGLMATFWNSAFGAASIDELAREAAMLGTADAAFVRLQEQIPGFGGLYIRDGAVYVYLTDLSKGPAHRPLLSAFANLVNPPQASNPEVFDPNNLQFLQAKYDFDQLQSFFKALLTKPLLGATTLDIDETRNVVLVKVKSAEDVANTVAIGLSVLVPQDALTVEVGGGSRPTADLNDTFRPTLGGNRISGPTAAQCTQGMTVQLTSGAYTGMRGFLTNSHCSATWGGVDSSAWYQAYFPNQIGAEVIDPSFYLPAGCPGGHVCRKAEVNFVGFSYTPYNLYGIVGRYHKPIQSCTLPLKSCPTTVFGGVLTATGPAAATVVGSFRNKIGATSGWTAGNATAACQVSMNIAGMPSLAYVCQDVYAMGGWPGDSGAPVFVLTSSTTIQMAGIQWADEATGNPPVFNHDRVVSSPLSGIISDTGMPTFTYY